MTRPPQILAAAREAAKKRRTLVARYRHDIDLNQHQIAQALNVSKSKIHNDFRAIDREWSSQMVEDVDTELRLDLARLDDVIEVLYPRVMSGDLKAIDRLLMVIDRRRRILGYTPPKRVKVDHDYVVRQYVGIDPHNFDQAALDPLSGLAGHDQDETDLHHEGLDDLSA